MLKKNKKFKVACIQMNSQANLYDNILFAKNKIIYASKKGAKLILLPENCFLMAKNRPLDFVFKLSTYVSGRNGICMDINTDFFLRSKRQTV